MEDTTKNSENDGEKQSILDSLNSLLMEYNASESSILSAILNAHNSLEGALNVMICNYYIEKNSSNNRKDKTNHFWTNILSDLGFAKKIRIIENTNLLTREMIDALYRINEIRNDLAHYPLRLTRRKKDHLLYNGKNIFKDIKALRMFYDDYYIILEKVARLDRA